MFEFFKKKYLDLARDRRFSEIFTGSAWAFSARIISVVCSLLFSVIVARVYGAEMLGLIAVINSFLLLSTIFTVFGTSTSILRLIPEHLVRFSPTSALKVYRKTHHMVILVSVVVSILLFFSANAITSKVFSKPYLCKYFEMAALFIVFQSMLRFNVEALRGLKCIRMFAILLFLPQFFNILFLGAIGIILPGKNVPVYAYFLGFTITSVIGWVLVEYSFMKVKSIDDDIEFTSCRNIITISLPMLLTSAMIFIIGQTGVFVIGIYRSESEVGYYSIAVKLASLTSFILVAVNSMAGPKFSELYQQNKIEELFYVAKKSAKLIFWMTLPILLGLAVFGKLMISLVYGPEYMVAYPALLILVVGQFVHSASGATGIFMNMTGNQGIFKNIMLAAACINILSNWMLVPYCGILGGAIAAMVSIVSWNTITLMYIKTHFGKTTGYLPALRSFRRNRFDIQ